MNQWPRVQCTRIVTLHLLFFELLPFVYFNTLCLSGPYLLYYKSYRLETSHEDGYHWEEVQCARIITLHFLFFELLPFVNFHTLILSEPFLLYYKSYRLETSYEDGYHWEGVQCLRIITLHLLFLSYWPLLISFVRAISPTL